MRNLVGLHCSVCGLLLAAALAFLPSWLLAEALSEATSEVAVNGEATDAQGSSCTLIRKGRKIVRPMLVQSLSQFGAAVAIDGPFAAIGARGEDGGSGSLYVFQEGDGRWRQEARLKEGQEGRDNLLGAAIAVSGNLMVAGAPRATVNGLVDAGTVSLFTLDAGGLWRQTARLTADEPGSSDHFGMAVGVWKNSVIVGAWNDNERGEAAGSAHIFVQDGHGWWNHAAKLVPAQVSEEGGPEQTAPVTAAVEEGAVPVSSVPQQFGLAVAIGKDFALVGAPWLSGTVQQQAVEAGAVYVFDKTGQTWTQSHILQPSEKSSGDGFGASIAVWDGFAIIGSPGDDSLGRDSGAAYIFKKSGNSWSQVARLTAADASAGDRFGVSVAMYGSHVAVGAIGHDGVGVNAGMTYIFEGLGSAWEQKLRVSPGFPSDGQKMGIAVALSSRQLLTGSDPDDFLHLPEQVYDFPLSPLIRAEKTLYDFGMVPPESESEEVEIFLDNPGEQATTIAGISLSSGDIGAFAIVKDRCSEKKLKPGRQCRIVARFTPDVVGYYEALLTVTSDQCLALDIPLRGVGASPGYSMSAGDDGAVEELSWPPGR